MKNLTFILVLILLTVSVSAQQLPLSSLYNVNKFQVNSAYAGFNNCLEGYLSHRSQWVGVEGAPTTQYLSVHTGINDKIGVGANVIYDKTNIISKFSGAISFAYSLKLGLEHNLRFGLSGGINQIGTTPSKAIVDDVSDDIVVSGNQSSSAFNNNFSLFYNYKKLEIGVSIPQVIETNAKFNIENTSGGFGLERHVLSTLGYDFDLTEKVSVQPSLLYRTYNGDQSQLDINSQVTFNRLISVGLGYRTNSGLLARLGMNVKELFTVAYAYEFGMGTAGSVLGGSHEIMLGVKFCKDKHEKIVKVVPEVIPEPVTEEVIEEIKEEEPVVIEKIVEERTVEVDKEKKTPLVLEETITEKESKKLINKAFETKVYYLKNGTDLEEPYKKVLDEIAKEMVKNPSMKIIVLGHSCDLGTSQTRETIGKKRAEVVRDYLVNQDVQSNQITIKSMSDSNPTVPNTSEANRQKNRRVEFVVK